MKSIVIAGHFIVNKETAMKCIADFYRLFETDGSMEASVVCSEVEDELVRMGFLTWSECEEAELSNYA